MTTTAFSLLIPLACTLGLAIPDLAAAQAPPAAPAATPGVTAKQKAPAAVPKAKNGKAAAAHKEGKAKRDDADWKPTKGATGAVIDPCNIPGNNLPECR